MSILFKMLSLCPVATWGLQAISPSHTEESSRDSLWIVSHMRSASSTILSMISATEDNTDGGDVFSLFEPCHNGDKYSSELKKLRPNHGSYECTSLIERVSNCDFSQISNLWGWNDPHTSNKQEKYSKTVAETQCKKANLIAVKTVGMGGTLEGPDGNITWILKQNPRMKILDVVRDPRGIYASKKEGHDGGLSASMIEDYCAEFSANLDLKHDRIHRIVFEDLVTNPSKVSKDVYKFLGKSWGAKEDAWVKATFNADCGENGLEEESSHHDCHKDSAAVATKWKSTISSSAKQRFKKNEDCVRVAKAYNFEL